VNCWSVCCYSPPAITTNTHLTNTPKFPLDSFFFLSVCFLTFFMKKKTFLRSLFLICCVFNVWKSLVWILILYKLFFGWPSSTGTSHWGSSSFFELYALTQCTYIDIQIRKLLWTAYINVFTVFLFVFFLHWKREGKTNEQPTVISTGNYPGSRLIFIFLFLTRSDRPISGETNSSGLFHSSFFCYYFKKTKNKLVWLSKNASVDTSIGHEDNRLLSRLISPSGQTKRFNENIVSVSKNKCRTLVSSV
jgi:hypothetical protein